MQEQSYRFETENVGQIDVAFRETLLFRGST